MRKTLTAALLGVVAFGFLAIATPEPAFAGKGGKGKKPPAPEPPPPCGCAVVIAGDGITCVLDDCAELLPGVYECLYTCTFN